MENYISTPFDNYMMVGAEISTLDALDNLRNEIREDSEKTRRMLDEFCAEVDGIVSETVVDLFDAGADFDAAEDRWFA